MACPEEAALLAFVRGEALAAEQELLHQHLAGCAACYQTVVHVLDSRELPPSAPGVVARPPAVELPRGASLGRYIVLDLVGRGGMGVVYAAYDPELDRKVAIKLIRSDLRLDGGGRRERLLREAQVMARLSHPNLLPVHDVGATADGVFIAMELVAGGTVRNWLRGQPSPAEILRVFVAAGRGLQALHAAGLVHRDFKPENVLVGEDGRVRVSDFGLARSTPSDNELAEKTAPAGTPGYMAPEQLRGEAVDARADQFAFSVALNEALEAAAPGEPPSRVRRIVERGQRVDPAARWPSMAELLAALESDPHGRRRRVALAAGLILMVAGGAAGLRNLAAHRRRECRAGEAELAGVWDPGARSRVADQFRRSGRPNAESAWGTVRTRLDRFAAGWLRMRTETCEATQLRGEQSQELGDLRMECLVERRNEVQALVALFESADPPLVDNAATATEGIDDLRACAEVRALRERVPPPAGGAARAAYDALYKKLARLEVLNRAGRHRDGAREVDAVVDEARRLDHPIPLSDAYLFQGRFRRMTGRAPEAQQSLHLAAMQAERGNDGERLATCWNTLALAALDGGSLDDAERWIGYAGAVGERMRLGNFAQAVHLSQVAELARRRGRRAEAAATEARTAELYQAAGSPAAAVLALSSLAEDLGELGRLDEGARAAAQALQIVDASLGRDHSYADHALEALGILEMMRAHYAEAEALFTRMHADEVASFGAESTMTYYTLVNLANSQLEQGHARQALETVEQAEALERRGPTEPNTGWQLRLLKGQALVDLGRGAEAGRVLEGVVKWAHQPDRSESERAAADFALATARRDRKLAEEAARHAAQVPTTPDVQRTRAAIDRWLTR